MPSRIALALLFILAFFTAGNRLIAVPSSGSGAEVIVLCYHTFLGKKINTDFSPEVFKKQIASMIDMGYRFVSYEDILSNRVSGRNNILITIDDGNVSLRKVFDSVLKTNGIKPVLFIYPAVIGRMHYAVTWKDLEYFRSQGATIGAHGYYHMFVTERFFKKDPKAFYKEIFKSKEKLEQKIGVPVDIYGYPFGVYSQITIDTLKKAGFRCAFALKDGVMQSPFDRNADVYQIPRYYVNKSTWPGVYKMLKVRSTAGHQAERRAAGDLTEGS